MRENFIHSEIIGGKSVRLVVEVYPGKTREENIQAALDLYRIEQGIASRSIVDTRSPGAEHPKAKTPRLTSSDVPDVDFGGDSPTW